RGLIGARNRLLNGTNGTIIMHHSFYEYEDLRGAIPGRSNGSLISTETGPATTHAIENMMERAVLFVRPQEELYAGQVIGENSRDDDLEVNICRLKKLTNIRAASADKTIVLRTPRDMSLELALEFIEDDELVEATPDAIRIRKRLLNE